MQKLCTIDIFTQWDETLLSAIKESVLSRHTHFTF